MVEKEHGRDERKKVRARTAFGASPFSSASTRFKSAVPSELSSSAKRDTWPAARGCGGQRAAGSGRG
jgi:hypothetical protein